MQPFVFTHLLDFSRLKSKGGDASTPARHLPAPASSSFSPVAHATLTSFTPLSPKSGELLLSLPNPVTFEKGGVRGEARWPDGGDEGGWLRVLAAVEAVGLGRGGDSPDLEKKTTVGWWAATAIGVRAQQTETKSGRREEEDE